MMIRPINLGTSIYLYLSPGVCLEIYTAKRGRARACSTERDSAEVKEPPKPHRGLGAAQAEDRWRQSQRMRET